MTVTYQHPTAGQIIIGASPAATRRVPLPAGVPPSAAGSIADQVVTQGAGALTLSLGAYFAGSSLSYALQSAVSGVSITGSTLTIDDTNVLAKAGVTVVASNAFGPNATQSFNREVRAPATGGTISIDPFVRDEVVFDLGTAVGDPEAQIPLSGTAGPGEVVQARAVSLDDFGISTTAWQDVATADGVGDWSGTLAFTSISNSRFNAEVRLKLAPSTTATGTKTFCIGHTAIDIAQSERYRFRDPYFSQNTPPEAIIDVREAVQQLAAPYRVGRVKPTSQQPFTIGVDALPTGITLSGKTVSVNPSTYDGAPFDNWYCPDVQFEVSDPRFVMRRSKIEVVSDFSIAFSLTFMNGGGFKCIRDCEMVALPGGLGFTAFLKEEVSGSGTGMVLPNMGLFCRNKLSGSSGDVFKVGKGAYLENLIEWTWNVPGTPTAWLAGTTFAAGDFTLFNGNYFRSKSSGNTGNQPPSTQTDNTYWQSWNPHSDFFNPQHGVDGGLIIGRNLIKADSARTAGNTLTGINNVLFRMDRDPAYVSSQNKIDKVLVEENVLIRDASVQSYAVSLQSGVNVTPPTFRGNAITPSNAGSEGIIYPNNIPAGTEWTDNRRTTDNTVIDNSLWANTVVGTYTSSAEKCVQFASHDDGTINPVAYINSGNRPTAGVAAMANSLISEYPGRRFALGAATKSGTSLSQLLNDASTVRQFAHYTAFADYLCPHGSEPGAITMYWQASDQNLGAAFGDNIEPMLTGKYLDGSPVTVPVNLGQRSVDHTMAEAHGPFTRTRFLLCGPGSRGPEEDMDNATHTTNPNPVNGSYHQFTMENYEKIRAEYRIMVASVGAQGAIHPFVGIQPLAHYCAKGDGVHPSDHVDGLPTMGRYIAIETLQGLGLLPDFALRFDQSFFASDGSYAEFWTTQGDVTTARRERGLAAIPATYPHRTEVFAWEIGNTWGAAEPAESATIVNGRVRIAPNTGLFADGQVFAFGRGGATGIIKAVDDSADRYDLNYPLVDLGFYKLDGLPIEPMPDPLILTASGIA